MEAVDTLEDLLETRLGRADCCILCDRLIDVNRQHKHSDVCENCATKEFTNAMFSGKRTPEGKR
jgi:hypothetical protein